MNLLDHIVVDSHCHAFLPEKETDSFEQYFTLADHPVPKEDMENTFIYRQVVRELSRILDVDGSHRRVVEERQRRYKEDPVGYIKLLFDDAKIDTLLVDTGYPSEEFSGYSVNLNDFSKIVPCNIKEIFRIDNVVYNLLKSRAPFSDALNRFHTLIKEAVEKRAVALKSVIAYRTGLEVQRSEPELAKKAYDEIVDKELSINELKQLLAIPSENVKNIFDYFVLLGIERSVELDVPFQIHVGMGDTPFIDLRLANPILLYDLINDASIQNARIVLTHGGYPWIEEAGFLVNTYPNVYLDLSETIPFISIGVEEKLLNLFEMAPTNKIMYGSDGYNLPELHWFSSIQTKKALERVLNGLIKKEHVEVEWAEEIALQFLSGNAKRIYDL